MAPTPPLLHHFDKILAAAALLWLGSAALGLLWQPPQLQSGADITAKIERIERYAEARAPSVPELPRWAEAIRDQLLAARVPQARPNPSWVFHRRPNLIFEFHERPPAPEAIHSPPTEVRARPRRGAIALAWKPAENNAFVRVEAYEVLRQVGEGPFERIATLGPAAREYVDDRAGPRVDLRYKIRSRARLEVEDPRVAHLRVEALTAAERDRDSEPTAPTRVPREVIVLPVSWSAPSADDILARGLERDLQGTVSYEVYINIGEGQEAEWVSHRFAALEGGLSTPARVGGERGQMLRAKGRRERFEFVTGAVLLECGSEPRIVDGRERIGALMMLRFDDGTTERVTSFDAPPGA